MLLLDEPLGALDAKLRKELQVELAALQREVGITFIYVTHDQEEALTMSHRLAVMDDGQVAQVGTPARSTSSRPTRTSPTSSASPTCSTPTGDAGRAGRRGRPPRARADSTPAATGGRGR